MNKIYLLMFVFVFFLFACSDNNSEEEQELDITEKIIGGWQLERIDVEGADCKTIYGNDVPEVYVADEVGCASPDEILGNAKRCINVDFEADGEGTFLWSEISGNVDAAITYTVMDDEVKYCFVGSACSGFFKLEGDKLVAERELRLDQECIAIFVLRRK